MARLPKPGSDDGKWGDILNDYLLQSLNEDGTIKANAVPANILKIGTVSTLPAGEPATATLTGTPPAQILSLGLPGGTAPTDANVAPILTETESSAAIDTVIDAHLGGDSAGLVADVARSSLAAAAVSTADGLHACTDNVGINILSTTQWRMHAQVTPNQVWSQDLIRIPSGSYVGPSQPPWLMEAATLAVTEPAPPSTIGTITWADDSAASVVHTSASSFYQWVAADTLNASAYGGGYRYTLTPGDYVTYTASATDTVQLSVSVVASVNGGYGLVSVDGSTTAATSLPTAQDEVDAGRLDSTALVANGGTLNPTDRLLNFYSASSLWDDRRVIATDLPAQAHTLVITCTGYKQGSATSSRIYSSGYGSAPYATIGTPTTTTYTVFPHAKAYSAYEYALDVQGDDGTSHAFVGNVHGYDAPTDVTVYVDGAPVDTTTTGDTSGSEVVIIRNSEISSPYKTGVVYTARVIYRLTRDGLDVRTRIVFQQAATLRGGYLAMYPLDESLSSGVIVGLPNVIDLTTGAGGAAGGYRALSQAAYAFNPTSRVTACMWIPDLTCVRQWANSSSAMGGMFIEDRAGNVINKIYATLVSTDLPLTLAAGDVLTGRTVYRAMCITDPTMLNPSV